MGFHFAQIAVVTDVIARTRLVDIGVALLLAGALLGHLESLKNRTGVSFSAAEIVNLPRTRRLIELKHETRDVLGMDVVTDLFAFVTVNLVFAPFEVAFDQVTEKAV